MTQFYVFADKNMRNLKIKSESEFSKIENWIKNNRLSLNYKKTNCVFFNNNKQNSSPKIDIKSQNGLISVQNFVKYLCVMINHKLSWQNHIQYNTVCSAKTMYHKRNINQIEASCPPALLRIYILALYIPT